MGKIYRVIAFPLQKGNKEGSGKLTFA